jgi:hypothetical protein
MQQRRIESLKELICAFFIRPVALKFVFWSIRMGLLCRIAVIYTVLVLLFIKKRAALAGLSVSKGT